LMWKWLTTFKGTRALEGAHCGESTHR
jgi:hypothetical protein